MAKLLVLVALACYAVHDVSSSRWSFKRAEALHQRKRQDDSDSTKVCCLPREFTLKADVKSTTGYGQYKMESTAKLEMVYSSASGSLYLSGSSDDMPPMSALLAISSDSVIVKVGMGSCEYIDYLKYSDSYLMKYVQGQICIPPEITNYVGLENVGDQDYELYSLYNMSLTYLFPQESTSDFALAMRAIRREDGSCVPVQFAGYTSFGPVTSFMTLELDSLDISDSVDSSKFDSAC